MNFNFEDVLGSAGNAASSAPEVGGFLGGAFAALAGFFLVLIVIALIALIYGLIVNILLYKKCGQAGWKAIIPFYSNWVLLVDICKLHWIVFVVTLAYGLLSGVAVLGTILGLASIFAYVCTNYNLAKKFGKDTGFAVGLTLLPVIFYSILAFSKNAVYNADAETKNVAFFDVNF